MKNKKLKVKRIWVLFLFVIFLGSFLFSLYKIIIWNIENKKNQNLNNTIKTEIVKNDGDDIIIDSDLLKKQNENAVGYIRVNNTRIDYPVLKYKDNKYYLNHNINNEYNSAGWIFADYRNNLDGFDKNIILYGHARLDGIMFGTMKKMFEKKWYSNKDNLNIKFFIGEKLYNYQIFSMYKIEPEDYYIQTDFNKESYKLFLDTIKKRSINKFNVNLDNESKILTLSTCTDGNKYRLVVHAVLQND